MYREYVEYIYGSFGIILVCVLNQKHVYVFAHSHYFIYLSTNFTYYISCIDAHIIDIIYSKLRIEEEGR